MKIPPLKWCLSILAQLSQAAATLTTVQLVFDAKLSLITTTTTSTPPPHPTIDGSNSEPTSLILAQHEIILPIMPLHLLGKKSWNVYNKSNIEKVRRDEAIAQAKEDAADERMQEIDAARRLAILRGEEPEPLPLPTPESSEVKKSRQPNDGKPGERRERKRRKRHGENDTDFELRIAKENELSRVPENDDDDEDNVLSGRQLVLRKETTRNAPVIDERGHINLFPQDLPPITHKSHSKADEKEAKADKIKARKEKQIEDQISLRFDNAAGYGSSLTSKAWYESSTRNPLDSREIPTEEEDEVDMIVIEKDVWGNEDPRRKDREIARVISNDPLALMKAGSRKLKEVERERLRWKQEREKELLELRNRELEDEEWRKRRKRKYGDEDAAELEGFLLNMESEERREKRRKRDDEERKRRRDGEGSGSMSRGGGGMDERRRSLKYGDRERGHGDRERRRDRHHGGDDGDEYRRSYHREERRHGSGERRRSSHHRRD